MRIIRNYFYTAGYNLLILLTPLLTVPYISRVLGPTGVGINATTNSIITYFLLFGTVGITIYGNREIAFIRDNRGQRSQTFWEIEILQLLTISCAYLAFLVFLFLSTNCKFIFSINHFISLRVLLIFLGTLWVSRISRKPYSVTCLSRLLL